MIKIICGVYGYYENGRVIPKSKNSDPFSLDFKREKELVEMGIAEFVNEDTTEEIAGMPQILEKIPEYDETTKIGELREIAKKCGLTFQFGSKKADILEALNNYFSDNHAKEKETPPFFHPEEAIVK